MNTCIFCKIVHKEVQAHIVYEDNDFIAFLDIRPLSPGHTLVAPKKHYRWVWDVPNTGEYFDVVKKIALAQKKAFNQEAILIKAVGEEVPHAHIWVYPNPEETVGDLINFEGNKEKLVEALK